MPMDFLPVDEVEDLEEIKPMFWRFGQKILGVAEHIRKDPRLYGIFITNFGCGPIPSFSTFSRTGCGANPTWRSRSTSTPPTWGPSPAWKPSWTACRM